jgi:hypothetical protein
MLLAFEKLTNFYSRLAELVARAESSVFWNFPLRMYMSQYLTFMLSSTINILDVNIELYSSWLAISELF